MTKEEYWYWLCTIKNLWNGKIRAILEAFHTPWEAYRRDPREFLMIQGLTTEDKHNIMEAKKRDFPGELSKLYAQGIVFVYPGHPLYPPKLLQIPDPPYGLYVRGQLPDPQRKHIALVGARACTSYGAAMASQIAGELARAGVGVISGLARGIDGIGHRGALGAGGKTYALLGSGLNVVYPREHIRIHEEILAAGGGIISEYPLDAPPRKWQFPQRNRLISGLSDGVCVVEARQRSGSLITVECALEQGKDVFAVPGRVGDPLSQGCNRLIQSGALLVSDTQVIVRELGIDNPIPVHKETHGKNLLEKEMKLVYSCLSLRPKKIDNLIEETGIDYSSLAVILIKLQCMGYVWEPVKNSFAKVEIE